MIYITYLKKKLSSLGAEHEVNVTNFWSTFLY